MRVWLVRCEEFARPVIILARRRPTLASLKVVFAVSYDQVRRFHVFGHAMNVDDIEELFERLDRSKFRQRFRLGKRERDYLTAKGLEVIMSHGADFVVQRLAPAFPENDGKQTPMRNHPVFVAQHATATCCRGCLEKWHGIPKGRALSPKEQEHVLRVIERWIRGQTER